MHFTKGQVKIPLNPSHMPHELSCSHTSSLPGLLLQKEVKRRWQALIACMVYECTHMSSICTQVAGLIVGLWLGLLLIVIFIAAIVLLSLKVRHNPTIMINLTLLHMESTVLA